MRFFKKKENEIAAVQPEPLSPAPPVHYSDWRAYDDVADDYARAVAPNFAPVAADLVAFAEIPDAGRLLDIGTGTGSVLVAAATFESFGVDPSVPMLRQAKSLKVAAAETINLPFRND